jgi:hypothetical protein
MYGFAILSSINYRQTMKFAVKYQELATPLVTMEFEESDGCGIWLVNPLSCARIDARLYKFIVENAIWHYAVVTSGLYGFPFFCAGIPGCVFPIQ